MRRESGIVLLWALWFMTAAALLLNALALRASFAGRDGDLRAEREAALQEARGGVRAGAWRGGAFERVDEDGALRVGREGERIVATFTAAGGTVARVSALWRDGRLTAWEED